ncbi:hypothetical protein SDC9_50101 [bioreactor metagenome]|uniref:Uncharacterized protein n=1 Tax=bioreactor metagenome TaxID=1076179 RepID=A0A644WNN1_9ZZZZ
MVDASGAQAASDCRATAGGAAAGGVGVNAPVEVAHYAQLTLKQDALVLFIRLADDRQRVYEHMAESFLPLGAEIHQFIDGILGKSEVGQLTVLLWECHLDAVSQAVEIEQVGSPDSRTSRLVAVAGTDAALGGADLHFLGLRTLLGSIEGPVIGHDQMGAYIDEQVVHLHAFLCNGIQFLGHGFEVDHGSRSNDVHRLGVENA